MSFDLFPEGAGGGMTILRRELFTSNGTWTKPAGLVGEQVWVTAIGGGSSGLARYGGHGGEWVQRFPVSVLGITSVSVTVGANGLTGSPSSFGSLLSVSGAAESTTKAVGNSAFGGSMGNTNYPNLHGQSLAGPFGGHGGAPLYPTSHEHASGGGGGLVLDASGTRGQSALGTGGVGYGAGGAGTVSGSDGAVLVEWLEVIE